jgi:hypothetical protein
MKWEHFSWFLDHFWPCHFNSRWPRVKLFGSASTREGINKRCFLIVFATALHSQASSPGCSIFWFNEHVLQ